MLALASLFVCNLTWAAKFHTTDKLSSVAMERLARVAENLQKDEGTFGDCSKVVRLNFTRKEEEKDINTIKQLNIAKAGMFDQDDPNPKLTKSAADVLASELLENGNQDEHETAWDKGVEKLTDAIHGLRGKKNLSIFEGSHANEDGSWKILDVLDKTNDQILLLTFGYCGT